MMHIDPPDSNSKAWAKPSAEEAARIAGLAKLFETPVPKIMGYAVVIDDRHGETHTIALNIQSISPLLTAKYVREIPLIADVARGSTIHPFYASQPSASERDATPETPRSSHWKSDPDVVRLIAGAPQEILDTGWLAAFGEAVARACVRLGIVA